jgi:N-acylneuraminate cytidylyltransferase/3-deoxy-D-manno-octulosonate 8-phosphate phosphatase (KDO 8-P phosphatase)
MDINIIDIDLIVLDFDGVLTDNSVYVDSSGNETVRCNRGDGLAFDVLRKINKPVFILSTEENKVVIERANKLKVKVLNGVSNKDSELLIFIEENGFSLEKTLYVGNDINDYLAMNMCGYSICPSDSHRDIKRISNIVLRSSGGNGVIREILEDVMRLNFIEILLDKG